MKLLATILFLLISLFLLSQNQQTQEIEAIIQTGHSKTISASAISSDGKYLATGSIDNSIIIWDAKTGKEIRVLQHHYKSIISLHFSADNKSVLSVSNDKTAKLVSVETGEVIHTFPHEKFDISSGTFNGDGSKIMIFDKREHYSVWDAYTGQLNGYFQKDYSMFDDRYAVSSNGEKALSKLNSNLVACISLVTKDTLFTMPFNKAYSLNFSPDGKHIVIGSSKLFATVFDGETGDSLHTVRTSDSFKCDGCKTFVKISDDSKAVFTTSNKGEGKLWQIKNGKIIQSFQTPGLSPTSLAITADGENIILNTGKQVQFYSIKSGKEVFKIENKDLRDFEVNIKNGQFILPGTDNSFDLWSVDRKKVLKNYSGYLNQKRADGLTYDYSLWIDVGILQYISFKTNIAIHPQKEEIAFGKVDSAAMILDYKTGKKRLLLTDSKKAILCQAYSKDGKWLATAGGDRKIRIYDTENYALKHTISGSQELIFDLQFSNDPNVIMSGSWDGTIRTWDIAQEKMLTYILLDGASPYIVRYSPNDLYMVSGDLVKNINFWETDTKTKFRTLIGHSDPISGIVFSNNGEQVLTASWDGKIKLWHTLTGMQIGKYNHKGAPVYAVNFSRDQKQIISGDGDRKVKFWDIETGELKAQLSGHISSVTDIKITPDGQYMITRGAKGEVILWDYYSKTQLYTYMQINQNDWLVTTPTGHFDGSKAALNLVNYVSGMEVVALESLFDKYYTPGLAKRVMNGERMNDTGENLNSLIKTRPQLAFQLTDIKTRSVSGVLKNDSKIASKSALFSVDVTVIENGDDISEIRFYNNGKLIDTRVSEKDLVFRGSKEYAKTFEVQLIDGPNNLKAIATTKKQVESDPITLQVNFDGEAAKTDLYILSIGINDYKNSNYNLNYAVKDAQDFSQAIAKGGNSLFNKVHNFSIKDGEANKTEIEAIFKQLISDVGPEDVFVFYYAGHGVMSLGSAEKPSDFFIVTHNVTSFFGESILAQEGISATELLDFSRKISAQKQLFILDACHSGGALNVLASRGTTGREKAIAQLARNTGTFFLTASQDAQYANESGDLKHGLFTYALLEVVKGDAKSLASTNQDDKITINEIKSYVEERVPELSQKYHGSAQYPTSFSFGQDFPIVILK